MEKIGFKGILFLFLVLLSYEGTTQSWITGMTFDYGFNGHTWDSTQPHNIVLEFPSRSYDETFEVKLNNVFGRSVYGGFKNHFQIKKNIIVADLSLGLNLYSYDFTLNKKPGSVPLDTSQTASGNSDSLIWDKYNEGSNRLSVKGIYPSIRLHLGYKRQLFNYRNLAFYADAGFMVQRRFSFFQDFNKVIYDANDTIAANFGNALNHRMFIPSAYLGFTLRMSSNAFGVRIGSNIGSITKKTGSIEMREAFLQITYSKLFKETHLGREQVIYDEYQHLTQTRAAEYRRGDKYSYLQFGLSHEDRSRYETDPKSFTLFTEGADSVLVTTNGYYIQPNTGLDFMLNTFFTHRWMMGMGISMYEESYTSYGTINQGDIETTFGDEVLHSSPDNAYQEYWTKTKAAIGLNTAIYVSKRALKIDPYVRGTANMVMNYDVPEFLKSNPDWRSVSFFPYYKIGAGADIRLRIKSSKFFVLGAGVDYTINPHINYLQYYIRVGYYRKKKLKNQTY